MSWVILFALLVLASIYTATPLLLEKSETGGAKPNLVADIRLQILELEQQLESQAISEEEGAEIRRALEMRAIEELKREKPNTASFGRLMTMIVPLSLVVGVVSLYAILGSPNFEREIRSENLELAKFQELSPIELAEVLAQKLANDPNPPPTGYRLLGRTLMSIEEHEKAIVAYKSAVELSGNDPAFLEEYEGAVSYVKSLSPTSIEIPGETIRAFEAMDQDAQDQMITGMVERLALKLSKDPSDIAGWQRLLQARRVLGQMELATSELRQGLNQLKSNPEAEAELLKLAEIFDIRVSN